MRLREFAYFVAAVMADDRQQTSAIFKRHEQLKRWAESDTNKCLDHTDSKPKKVKFQDGCVFLAACSSGDHEEVKRLLERGADINTANVDGLTALHQACIDDNLDMVEFLVENGADVDVCDNEGWTPLHATASCGFTEIARYLLQTNANVAAVNNDGDLPFDICEADEMEKLLQQAMDDRGVDADAARREEEDRMMEDANSWLNSNLAPDDMHPKTGATALHVAASKGYTKVINVLLQAGVDINAKDNDGWSSLHAAAHWGQEEACKILAENMCDMETKNLAGQTAFDVADTELVKLLEELKLKQASLKDQHKDTQIIHTKVPSSRRRSSVTRMSGEQKHHVMKVEKDGVTLDPKMTPQSEEKEEKVKGSSSSGSEEETSEQENEKTGGVNKQSTEPSQPRDRDKPPIMTTVEIKEKAPEDGPKDEDTLQTSEKENQKNLVEVTTEIENETEVIGDGLKKNKFINNDKTEIQKEEEEREKEKANEKEKEKEITIKDISSTDVTLKSKENQSEVGEKKKLEIIEEKENKIEDSLLIEKEKEKEEKDKKEVKEKEKEKENENVPPRKDRERDSLKRTASAPPAVTEIPRITINTKSTKDESKGDGLSWRSLRKTGSTSLVPQDTVNTINKEDKNLPRSASSPRLAEENENKKNEQSDKPQSSRRPFYSSSSFSTADHNNSSVADRYRGSQDLTNPYRYTSGINSTTSAYAAYRRNKLEDEQRRERAENNRISAPAALPVTTAATITTTSGSTTITTPTSSFLHNRKSYEPPKRDEETETKRKVRAKRARETRRSTQGVTLEEVKQANEVLRRQDPDVPISGVNTATDSTDSRKSQDLSSTNTSSDKVDSRLSSDYSSISDRRTNPSTESDSLTAWRLSKELRSNDSDRDSGTTRSSSFRRSRDLGSSAPASSFYADSTYVPRSQRTERTALSVTDGNASLGGSTNLQRSTSLRSDRIRPTIDDDSTSRIELRRERKEASEQSSDKSSDKEEREKRPESTAMRNRRLRRERRSTGIENFTAEANDDDADKDKDKENSKDDTKDENKTDSDDRGSGRFNRYGSASDVPSHLSSRPSSYTEYSRSTSSLEKDYKKLYEDEKTEKERLKRELEQCKRELRDAKSELDRQMKRHEASRVTDTNDKRERRALERKLSELEEEIKKMDQLKEDNRRLREENGALIRVISKLSK